MFEAQNMKGVNDGDWLDFLRKVRPGIRCGTSGGFEAGSRADLCMLNSQLRTGADKGNPTV